MNELTVNVQFYHDFIVTQSKDGPFFCCAISRLEFITFYNFIEMIGLMIKIVLNVSRLECTMEGCSNGKALFAF